MNATDRTVFARMLSKANSDLDEDAALDTVTDYMPEFIAHYTDKPRTFKMNSSYMQEFIHQVSDKYGLDFDQNYINTYIAPPAAFNAYYNNLSKMVSVEKHNKNMHLGKYLQTVLSPYTSLNKINELGIRYNSKNWHIDPSSAFAKHPNSKRLQKQQAEYDTYVVSAKRAKRLLKYLNNNRINTRIDVDDLDTSKLAVYLPEHNDMKVTLMADDPKQIGETTTWNNSFMFSKNKAKNIDADDLPPEAIVDTLINPRTQIKGIDSFYAKSGQPQHTNLYCNNLKVPIFVTSLSSSIKSIKQSTQENEIIEANDDDELDDDNIKITNKDKIAEIQKRYQDKNYQPIQTPEQIKAERDNHGLYTTIMQQAHALGLSDVQISKNSHGVYKYNYVMKTPDEKYKGFSKKGYGIIGGYIQPEKDGSNKLVVNDKLRGYSVPGMRGYIDTNTSELKVKRFSAIMREQIRKSILDQVANPALTRSTQSYAALDNLYTTDAYSTIIQKGINSPKYEQTLINTLSKRVRLTNDVIEAGNAYNEDPDHVKANTNKLNNIASTIGYSSREKLLATKDLRTIPEHWQKYVDREMTGIGKTMGASLFLGDDVKINTDGSLDAPKDRALAKTALHKLPIFDYDKYDPADRNIMAFNQTIRNVPLDKVNVAMMTMSGYTENDAAVVSAKYAQNHQITLPNGEKRDLKRGDKITDLHGNKSTISEVIDPNEKDPARRRKLAREIAIMQANPDLDVVVNPYSSISRLNTGSIREMQANELKQLNNPQGYNIDLSKVSMGKEYYAVCLDQRVDEKTKVYSKENYQDGQSRRFSHQLAAGAASADLPKLLTHVYSNTIEKGWPKFFDDLHLIGYDIDKEHQLGYVNYDKEDAVELNMPSDKEIAEIVKKTPQERKKLQSSMFKSSFKTAMNQAENPDGTTKPIIMTLKEPYQNAADNITNKVIIPYEQIKADAELALKMGSQVNKVNSATLNSIHRIYDYNCGIRQDYQPVLDENGKKQYDNRGRVKQAPVYTPKKAGKLVNNLANQILAKDFGTNNIVKTEIYSAPMPDSATAVVTPDPNLDIDEVAVGQKIYDNLNLQKPDEGVLIWRDPILRDGGFRFVNVKPDKTLTGIAINPMITKSMDADFDGDTLAIVPIHDQEVQKELEKQRPSHNLLNKAAKMPESYLETGLELQGSLYRQGDLKAQEDLKQTTVTPDTVRAIAKEGFQNDTAYGIGIDVRNKDTYFDSLSTLIESGAKGKCERDKNGVPLRGADKRVVSKQLEQAKHYYDGERTNQDFHESMIGSAVKVDGVGPAGSVQQKLLWVGRDQNPKDVMDFTYLATQSALQAKHDGKEAIKRMHAELGPIPKLMSGQLPEGQYDPKNMLSRDAFVGLTDDLYNNQLGLNVNTNTIEGVADIITDQHNKIMPDSKRIDKADPLDLLAYKHDSVIKTLDTAIANDKKIAVGRYSKCFSLPDNLCSDQVLGRYYKEDQEKQQQAAKRQELQQQTTVNQPKQTTAPMSLKQDSGLEIF